MKTLAEIDVTPYLDRFRSPAPFAHQVEGVRALVNRKAFAIFDEPQIGKSRQVIDAACILSDVGEISTVVVIAPFKALSTWAHDTFGQIKTYAWKPVSVFRVHKEPELVWRETGARLMFIVANYEAIRSSPERLGDLVAAVERRRRETSSGTWLVADESSYLENRTSAQSKAVIKIRTVCDRATILNGTPGDPLGQWNQFNTVSKKILFDTFKNFYSFRAKYANLESIYVAGGRRVTTVARRDPYKNLDDLSRRTAPYVLRRLKKDCLDLPPKLGGIDAAAPIFREVPLSQESWQRYKTLRKEAIIALGDSGDVRLEPNAGVRILRLAQLTSGHHGLSGAEDAAAFNSATDSVAEIEGTFVTEKIVSSEKIDYVVDSVLRADDRYTIIWTRWIPTRKRIIRLLEANESVRVFGIYGGQKEAEREEARQHFLRPELADAKKRYVLVAQPQAGGMCLSLPLATRNVFESNTTRLLDRQQAEERAYGPAQKFTLTIEDVFAVGPNGERTIDAIIFERLREHQEISKMTASEWRKELEI